MNRKQEETARVAGQEQLAEGIFSLLLETSLADSARPGQFVNLYCGDRSRLLPRPISICEAGDGRLRLVYRTVGEGTREFAALRPGDEVRILGCLGNGYDLEAAAGRHVVVTGGGLGVPPMLFTARLLRERMERHDALAPAGLTVVPGYRDRQTVFLDREFEGYGRVLYASDDGSIGTKGTVTDVIRAQTDDAEVIYACGPLPMLRSLAGFAEEKRGAGLNITCYVSLEERMACGIGTCLGCVVKTTEVDAHSRVHNARICTEGPVFDSRQIVW